MSRVHESKQENPQPAANELIDITVRLQAIKSDKRIHEVAAMDDPVVIAYAGLMNHLRRQPTTNSSESENDKMLQQGIVRQHFDMLISSWPQYCEESRDLILQHMYSVVKSVDGALTWAGVVNEYMPKLIQQVNDDNYISKAAFRHLYEIVALVFPKRLKLYNDDRSVLFKRVCEVIALAGWGTRDRLAILKHVEIMLNLYEIMLHFMAFLNDYTHDDKPKLLQYCDGIFNDWVRHYITECRSEGHWLGPRFKELLKSYCRLYNMTGENIEKIWLLVIEKSLWQLMTDSPRDSQSYKEAVANYRYFMGHSKAPLLHEVISQIDAVERVVALPSFCADLPKDFTQDFLDQTVDSFATSSQMNQARLTEYILVDAYVNGDGEQVQKLSPMFGDPAGIDRVFAYNSLQQADESLLLGLCHTQRWGVVPDVSQALSHFDKAHREATTSSTIRQGKALVIEIQLHLMLQCFPHSIQEITNALVDCYVRRGQYSAALKVHLQCYGEIQPSAVAWLVQYSDSMAYDREVDINRVVIAAEEAMQSDGEAKQEELPNVRYNKLSLLEACERLGNSGAAAWQSLANYHTNHPTTPDPHKAALYRDKIKNANEQQNRQQMLDGIPLAANDIKANGSWSVKDGLMSRTLHRGTAWLLATVRSDDTELALGALKAIADLLLNTVIPVERGARKAFIQLYSHLSDAPYDQGVDDIGEYMPAVLKAAIAEREEALALSEPSAPEAAPAATVAAVPVCMPIPAPTPVNMNELSVVYHQLLRAMAQLTDLLKGGAQLTAGQRDGLKQQYADLQQQLPSHSTSQRVVHREVSISQVASITTFGLVTQAGRNAAPVSSNPETNADERQYVDPPCV
ncbi:MAG: hypothetical protein P1U40_00415 [Coxiellaceae bacterium]|nr:hypothetical protein [Coxiellaceae bacterium]